jgi:serine/threonine protein kinase/Tol biopolymer transport system component
MTSERWRQISAVYHEALARPVDARGLYVQQACAGDDELQREVEALLAADARTVIVDVPAIAAVARGVASESPAFLGHMLGVYQITKLLGVGGMGEVYQARDTRLDRTVALKVLPAALAANPQFRERFKREARAISRLDDPHICTLYDVGEQDGTSFIVMQYLEGETLGQRLKEGPIPPEEALRFAIQIAGALDKAHQAGIVHRDLKPSNIMLTTLGAVLLDFGLAKNVTGADVVQGMSASTPLPQLTSEGVLVGTVQYMAPEQIEGRETDGRTDVFALGAVIYEMITGRPTFAERTQAGLIGAILKDTPPPISDLQPQASVMLDRVVRRCLAKDPDERWQSAADVSHELKWVAEAAEPSRHTIRRKPFDSLAARERMMWAAATVAAIGAALSLGLVLLRSAPDSDGPPMHSVIALPKSASLNRSRVDLAISPDGSRLAFLAQQGTRTLLWIRAFDAIDAQPLADTEGAAYPFWSPDGRSLGFVTNSGTLKAVDGSGAVRVIHIAPTYVFGGTWGPHGTIVFGSSSAGLFSVSESGGEATALTKLDARSGETSHQFPVFLPDGRHLLYWSKPSNTTWLMSLDSNETTQLLSSDSPAKYLEPGYLLFGRQATLMVQSFEWGRGILNGAAVPLVQKVLREPSGALSFGVSSTTLVYRVDADAPLSQLTWFDRNGRRLGAIEPVSPYRNPTVSPDGKRVAVEMTDRVLGTQDAWLVDTDSGLQSRLTFDPANDVQPIWSPDGHAIIFGSDRSGVLNLYRRESSGAGSDEVMFKSSEPMSPNTMTPDGNTLLYRTTVDGVLQIGILPLIGERRPRLFDRKRFSYSQGRVSPDGKWIAYQANNESGPAEVYIESFPAPGGGKWQISKNGGSHLRWRRDGRELIYYGFDHRLMSVPIANDGAGLAIGAAVPLFGVQMLGGAIPRLGWQAQFDVAPDGRLLLNMPVEDSDLSPINLVANWKALIKQ